MRFRSTAARNERPIKRWISLLRPLMRPLLMSRGVRSCVARGNIAYSALTQPVPCPRMNGGTRSSTDAVQCTAVFPHLRIREPSA